MTKVSNNTWYVRFVGMIAVLALVPWKAFGEEIPEDDPTASYEQSYLSPVQTVCDTVFRPEKSLIRQASFPYPQIGNTNAQAEYREMVRGVGGDFSALAELYSSDVPKTDGPFKAQNDIQAASEAYKERTNALFACAQIDFKIRTHDRILKTVRGEAADAGNMAERLKEQTKMLRQESEKRQCTDLTSTEGASNLSVKKVLLDNAFYQYCDYRHYLQYLKSNISNRMSKFYENKKDTTSSESDSSSLPAEKMVTAIGSSVAKIDVEITHTREVFPQAMAAYSEFERTYGSHVLLLFIAEDYRLLRESLKKVMNPLGQVIYKASNAQSPYSR